MLVSVAAATPAVSGKHEHEAAALGLDPGGFQGWEIRLWVGAGSAYVQTLDRFRVSGNEVSGTRLAFTDLRRMGEDEKAEARSFLAAVCRGRPLAERDGILVCEPVARRLHDRRLLESLEFEVLWDLAQDSKPDVPTLFPAPGCEDLGVHCLRECIVLDGSCLTVEILSGSERYEGTWCSPDACCDTPRCQAAEAVLRKLWRLR